jgi:hypothetical protein
VGGGGSSGEGVVFIRFISKWLILTLDKPFYSTRLAQNIANNLLSLSLSLSGLLQHYRTFRSDSSLTAKEEEKEMSTDGDLTISNSNQETPERKIHRKN